MAEHQVTHDNETLEEKEQKIQDYLDEHGLTIDGAPPVHHQEANTISDDIYYPKFLPPVNEKVVDIEQPKSKYDGVNIFDTLEDIPSYSDPKVKLISPRLISQSQYNFRRYIPAAVSPQTGLCLGVEELKSYVFTIARKTGLFKVTVMVDDVLSVLTFDGDKFKTYVGKVISFYVRSVSTEGSHVKTEVFLIMDTTPAPFESHTDFISANQIVDIADPGKTWDITEYGIDIKKKYTDWVEELRKGNYKEEKVVVVPSGNLKEFEIPVLDLGATTLEQAGITTMDTVFATVNTKFMVSYLDGVSMTYLPGEEWSITVVSAGFGLFPAIKRKNVLYFIPAKYLSFTYK